MKLQQSTNAKDREARFFIRIPNFFETSILSAGERFPTERRESVRRDLRLVLGEYFRGALRTHQRQ